jgi:hypothetical protein
MFKHYKEYKEKPESLVEPEQVAISTEKYKNKNDIFDLFKRQKLMEKEGATLSVKDAFTIFQSWYTDTYPGFKEKTSKPSFTTELSKHLNQMPDTKSRWHGYEIKLADDDLNSSQSDSEAGSPLRVDSDSDDDMVKVKFTDKVIESKSKKSEGSGRTKKVRYVEEDITTEMKKGIANAERKKFRLSEEVDD